MKSILWALPVFGLVSIVSGFEAGDEDPIETDELHPYEAAVDENFRVRRSPEPEPYVGPDGGRPCLERKPDGTYVRVKCAPGLIYYKSLTDPKASNVQRFRRSPDPEPFKGPVGGGSGFQLPPGVTPFNPNAKPYKRPRRSPQRGGGSGVRPPPRAPIRLNKRFRRSPDPEPFKAPVGGGSGFQLPPGVTPFNPNAKPYQVQRPRRSPDPEPFKGPVGGGSGFQLPPGVTPFNPNAKPYKRPRRSPQPGDGPGVRPPPSWRPPIRPVPIPFKPLPPRDPGRPWLQMGRR